MTILQAIILGLVQGITEFAPISSSGHLILVPWMFGWQIVDDPALNKTFDVALHMGTFVGAVIYFRRDLWVYIKAFFASIGARANPHAGRTPGVGARDRHDPGHHRRCRARVGDR